MDLNNIIIKPYHTEKSYRVRKFQDPSCIAFIVNRHADKKIIKLAFKTIYNIDPVKVNVVNRKSQEIRTGTANPGRSKFLKIAYVVLPKGLQIAITKDEMEEAVKNKNETVTPKKETQPKIEKKPQTLKEEPKVTVTQESAPKKKPIKKDPPKVHVKVETHLLDEYDYEKKLKIWNECAGDNEKQTGCDKCKHPEIEKTILLADKRHICYHCWIIKPENIRAGFTEKNWKSEESLTAVKEIKIKSKK